MCGICGYVSRKRITEDELRIMNDKMIHRGPNDSGVELYESKDGYTVGFAHRRLSINDLSPLGHQPMADPSGRLEIIFNGEIYNFLELKKELSDYPYKGGSDTEVILAAYLKWGISMVDHIHGMFAIALFDRECDSVYLIRDRIGKKPVYYWMDEDNIVFASELKPIMSCPGFEGEIRKELLPRYIHQQYINAPDTIFKNVFKLEPGSVLEFKLGNVRVWKYWDVYKVYDEKSADPIRSYEEAKQGLKDRLREAVRTRMIADVPLGTFLSGGYDSSLVTAIAQELSDEPVKTFTIGFNVPRYNEAQYAKEVAQHLGTKHTELYIDEKEMFDLVESIPQFFDEPFADNSEIPTMLVSKLARRDVTVALSGDAGDEFFCGYNIYDNVAQAQKLDLLGAMAYGVGKLPIGGGAHLFDKYPFRVKVVAQNRDYHYKTQLGSPSYIEAAQKFVLSGDDVVGCKYRREGHIMVPDWQVKRMLLDMDTYLPGDILCKMDRAAMKYSLEARCPIMDTEVMEYSFRIPHKYKYYNGDKKHILKDIAYDYIPKELLNRPKVGFGVPQDEWLRGPLKDKLIEFSSTSFLNEQNIFDTQYVTNFVDNYLRNGDGGPATGANFSKICWSFFVFQQWYEYYKQYIKL